MHVPRNVLLLTASFILSAAGLPAQTQPAQTPKAPVRGAVAAPNASQSAAPANPQTPAEFFARSRQLSDLEAYGIPFHLKATFVASGDAEPVGNGTYEEWWQSKDMWRKEATLGNFRYISIQNGKGDLKLGTSSSYIPLRLRQVLQSVPVRIPVDGASSGDLKTGHAKIAKMELTTISSEYPCQAPGPNWPKEKKLNPQKCLVRNYFAENGLLRMSVVGATTTAFNNLQPFGNQLIPLSITEADASGTHILSISISMVELLANPDKKIQAPVHGDLKLRQVQGRSAGNTIAVGHSVMASRIVRSVQPVYPLQAKQNHIQGTVVIEATIDAEGNIREPYVTHSAGFLLDQAALAAVGSGSTGQRCFPESLCR